MDRVWNDVYHGYDILDEEGDVFSSGSALYRNPFYYPSHNVCYATRITDGTLMDDGAYLVYRY